MREEHCSMAKLNIHGKCIALCSKNNPLEDCDCTGTKGETSDHPYVNDNQYRRIGKHGI
jgi:hypothetical protein